jgi:hypothetical protein
MLLTSLLKLSNLTSEMGCFGKTHSCEGEPAAKCGRVLETEERYRQMQNCTKCILLRTYGQKHVLGSSKTGRFLVPQDRRKGFSFFKPS